MFLRVNWIRSLRLVRLKILCLGVSNGLVARLLGYLLALWLLGLVHRCGAGRPSEVELHGLVLRRLHGQLVVGLSLVTGHVDEP